MEFTKREQQIQDDYDWVLHDADVQRTYAGQVVVVHEREIWGAGKNHTAALKMALRRMGCPPREALAMVFVEGCPVADGEKGNVP